MGVDKRLKVAAVENCPSALRLYLAAKLRLDKIDGSIRTLK